MPFVEKILCDDFPDKRSLFGVCNGNNIIYLFGGKSDKGFYNDMWSLNGILLIIFLHSVLYYLVI